MNAQLNALASVEIEFRCSLSAAETILDGLAKLPIERASALYASLREVIDKATTEAITAREPAPPAPAESTQQPQETPAP